jgi:histidinol dehydrogenase
MQIIENFETAKEVLRLNTYNNLDIPVSTRQSITDMFSIENLEFEIRQIVNEVRLEGDVALHRNSLRFDLVDTEYFEILPSRLEEGFNILSSELKDALHDAEDFIKSGYANHKDSLEVYKTQMEGRVLVRPIERLGICVRSKNPFAPQRILQMAIPAHLVGVPQMYLLLSPDSQGGISPVVLGAAYLAGFDRVFRLGGAHGVAALAFGTESIPKVDKILCLGDIFAQQAKTELVGVVDIDGFHENTRLGIIIDDLKRAKECAIELTIQFEYDKLASVLLITDGKENLYAVVEELRNQIKACSNPEPVRAYLDRNLLVILNNHSRDIGELIDIYSPGRLVLLTDDPDRYTKRINNTGCIYIGDDITTSAAEFCSPALGMLSCGTHANYSSLGPFSFIKTSSLVRSDASEIDKSGKTTKCIAKAEGLDGHAKAMEIRLKGN